MSGSAFHAIPQAVLDQWKLDASSGNHPRQPDVAIPVTIILSLAVVIFVGIRAWARLRIQRKADTSDWLIFACAPMTLAYLIMVGVCTQTLYNRHLWELDDNQRVVALRYFFFGYFFYFWNSALVRLSILFFYLRLTNKDINKKFVWTVYATIAFTILYWVVFDISLIFTCRPVEAFWNRADPAWVQAHEYQCFDEGSHIMAASAIAALDLFIAVLPAMIFWNLRLPRRQKIALWALFAVGACTAVASLVRMYYIYLDFWKSYDFTWIGYQIWLWTSTELAVAIVCASAPSLKSIFIKFFGGVGVREKMRKGVCKVTGRAYSSSDNTSQNRTPDPTTIASQLLDSANELQQKEKVVKHEPTTSLWEDITSRFPWSRRDLTNKSRGDIEALSTPSELPTTRRPTHLARDESWSTYDQSGFGAGGKGVTIVTSRSRTASRASRISGDDGSADDSSMSDVPEMPPLPMEEAGSDDMVVHVQTTLEVSESPVLARQLGGVL